MAKLGMPSTFAGTDNTGMSLFHNAKNLPAKEHLAMEMNKDKNAQGSKNQPPEGGSGAVEASGEGEVEGGIAAKRLPRFQKLRKEMEQLDAKVDELLQRATVSDTGSPSSCIDTCQSAATPPTAAPDSSDAPLIDVASGSGDECGRVVEKRCSRELFVPIRGSCLCQSHLLQEVLSLIQNLFKLFVLQLQWSPRPVPETLIWPPKPRPPRQARSPQLAASAR